MEEQAQGCARVTASVVDTPASPMQPQADRISTQQGTQMSVRVGQKAPDFSTPAYYRGSFGNVKLSDFAGKWVMLCFYPGDFTFV
jgi:hypothetical protein